MIGHMIGDNKLNYKYINSDVFNNKINYSYSKFGGIEFIKTWEKTRTKCLDIFSDVNNVCYEIIDDSKTNIEFQKWLSSSNTLYAERDKIHLLLKRFEVTKRIYEIYDCEYRRLSKDVKYNNLNLYINFGFVIINLYNKNKHLQYVNSLLKLLDIICSRMFEFNSDEELFRYGAVISLITEEKKIITDLCNENNIEL
jgi:hypothetical protein